MYETRGKYYYVDDNGKLVKVKYALDESGIHNV